MEEYGKIPNLINNISNEILTKNKRYIIHCVSFKCTRCDNINGHHHYKDYNKLLYIDNYGCYYDIHDEHDWRNHEIEIKEGFILPNIIIDSIKKLPNLCELIIPYLYNESDRSSRLYRSAVDVFDIYKKILLIFLNIVEYYLNKDNLNNDILILKKEKDNLNNEKDNLNNDILILKKDKDNLNNDILILKKEKDNLNNEKDNLNNDILILKK
jgi:hypothetical protein